MDNPLVSILMPTYNSEKYIAQAIESVISQTYDTWELIICDDCSTDSTYSKASEYSNKDSRIKVIRNSKNMRQAYSRNKALEISNGKYIALLDSDDRMKESRLQKQVHFLENNHDYSFVCTEASLFNNSDDVIGYITKKAFPSPFDVIRNKGFVYGSMMIRSDAIKEVNGYTVSDITKTGEDYDLICKLYFKDYKGANIKEYLYEYRIEDVYKRRPYSAYLNEYKVAHKHIKLGWLKKHNISGLKCLLIFAPLIKGLIPQSFIKCYHSIIFKKGS